MRTVSRLDASTAMMLVPLDAIFCSRMGVSEIREVWMSRSATPLSFSDASRAVINLALAVMASRAVLAWPVTPACRTAMSGALLMLASPVTEIDGGLCSGCACAETGAARKMATRPRRKREAGVMVMPGLEGRIVTDI